MILLVGGERWAGKGNTLSKHSGKSSGFEPSSVGLESWPYQILAV